MARQASRVNRFQQGAREYSSGDDGAAIQDEVKPDARRARQKIGFHSLTTQCHGLTVLFDIDNHYHNKVFNNDLQDATR